ncbi:NmrA domain-containing protein [Mycena sanguinolenta]|uniref:NmrA domain-containing protein n=1 Tax=Mycena sanguinolenta TaxID=230812 RepID=A0A8H7DG87_9AGAR|nr:NmrA domain-containing protein [Mycena sanguinolenta]
MTIIDTRSESAPLIAVVGATGVQGGSVIKALLESDKPYRIRGFTRDPTKAAAERLKKCGVDMVGINLVLENKEEVFKAFAGADYVFLVTNFWEHMNVQKEISEGIMLVDAAKAAGVKGIIWSGLVSAEKISGGKYSTVQQFNGKALVTEHGRASSVPFVTVQAGLYASSYLANPLLLAKQPDGTHAIQWVVGPKTVVPIIDTQSDYGLYVRRVLEQPVFPDGLDVYTGQDITGEDMAREISEVTGKKVVFKQITTEEFTKPVAGLGLPPHIIDAAIGAFQFWEEFGYYGGQPTASTDGLARAPLTWAEFVKNADWSKVLA